MTFFAYKLSHKWFLMSNYELHLTDVTPLSRNCSYRRYEIISQASSHEKQPQWLQTAGTS